MQNLNFDKELLIVEDDEEFVSLILQHMEGKAVEFDCARNIEQAWEFLTQKTYKVISLDVFLGQENCGQILQSLRQDAENQNNQSNILICSAAVNPHFAERMKAKGYQVFSKQNSLDDYFFVLNKLTDKDLKDELSKALDEYL